LQAGDPVKVSSGPVCAKFKYAVQYKECAIQYKTDNTRQKYAVQGMKIGTSRKEAGLGED
jgi:hypothetical protein